MGGHPNNALDSFQENRPGQPPLAMLQEAT
jgi:hypothetical protein